VTISIGALSLLSICLSSEFSMEHPVILKRVKLVLWIRTRLKSKLKNNFENDHNRSHAVLWRETNEMIFFNTKLKFAPTVSQT
jgi:hypothetical protein